MPADAIEQMEIEAYIDGEVDLARRLAVEDHLARHPALAAQVMADFRTRTALQLLTIGEPAFSRSLARTVARIQAQDHSKWRRPITGTVAAVMVGLLTMIGLQMNKTEPPAYIGLAVASHRSIINRPENLVTTRVSAQTLAILSASRIAVPNLPADWRVTDVQLLSTKKGPAMMIAVRTTEGCDFSIFATRERSSAPREPDAVREGLQSVAYWSAGDISYALTGEGDPQQLDAKAEALADLWRA